MSKQVRIRRDSKTNLNSVVPASSELAHETTNNRVHIGNGSTSGGIILPNARDVQNNNFITGTIGGTANAITLTISDPPTAYASGQQFLIRPTANNTGATTINVNGLGAVNILKNVNGTLTALASNDLRTNIWYEITYDGTQFQLGGGGGGGGIASTNIVTFTASGTYTPPANLVRAHVRLVAGGGSGGVANGGSTSGGATGGASGGYSERMLTAAQIGASQTVTIGAGGAARAFASDVAGLAGGTTSFGSLLSATGGQGGNKNNSSGVMVRGAQGGVGSTGDVNMRGGASPNQNGSPTGTNVGWANKGGDSVFGSGGMGGEGATAGEAGQANSGAGGGAGTGASGSGAGAAGIVIITEFLS